MDPRLEAQGFKVLFYYTEDPRTVALSRRRGGGPVRTPADLDGVSVRIPASSAMKRFYELAGAVPIAIPWGETLDAIRDGGADALDPAATTLCATGYANVLSCITFIAPVPDAQVYACNVEWFRSLPEDLRRAVEEASAQTMAASFTALPACRQYALERLATAGVTLHVPSSSELADWREATGEQRREWDHMKVELTGAMAVFETLKAAANTPGPILC